MLQLLRFTSGSAWLASPALFPECEPSCGVQRDFRGVLPLGAPRAWYACASGGNDGVVMENWIEICFIILSCFFVCFFKPKMKNPSNETLQSQPRRSHSVKTFVAFYVLRSTCLRSGLPAILGL